MSIPKIEIRSAIFKSNYKHRNLMAVNINHFEIPNNDIYMPSEISHLIAKLMFNSSIYADVSRLFKVSLPRNVKAVQVILLENISDEELTRLKMFSIYDFSHFMENENFSEINFASSSSWCSSGLDEFLTLPIKSLTILGTGLIVKRREHDSGQSLKRLTPQVLLSTPTEMYWDNVPSPNKIHVERDSQFLFSQSHYKSPNIDAGNILAIDCEMVNTSTRGDTNDLALARVSVVRCVTEYNEDLTTMSGIMQWHANGSKYEVVYDVHVKPALPITDYLTNYSGITARTLENVMLTLEDVQSHLSTIITSNTILVGHSIQMDLKTLRLYHPFIIDTSTIYNTSGDVNRKPGLFELSRDIIKSPIRKGTKAHDSVEDAYASLRLVMKKLLKDMNFGNKTRIIHVQKPANTDGESQNVINSGSDKSNSEVVTEVPMCKIAFETPEKIEGDIQATIDRFTLLTENPAVIGIPELMCATNTPMELIVNANGTLGKLQNGTDCVCVHRENSDSDVVSRTLQRCEKNRLLVSVLSDYVEVKPGNDPSDRITRMLSLQQNIQKISLGVSERTALMVILPGQSGVESTGKLFWKVK